MPATNRRLTAALRPVTSSFSSSSYKPASSKNVNKPPKWKRRIPKSSAPPPKPLPPPRTLAAPLNVSYPLHSYEDEYEDEIIVNSVELGPSIRSIGVEHYLEQVAKLDPDDFTPLDVADYSRRESATPSFASPSGSDSREEDAETGPEIKTLRGCRLGDEGMNHSDVPIPPLSAAEYQREIYKANTTNPSVCLAIIRIAEKNMPLIDFSSAINHLPNLRPKDPLPKLRHRVLYAQPRKRHGDIEMNVIFLPHFYQDGRHALGYYALSPEPDNWSWTPKQGCLFVKHELFTPCTTGNLIMYDLVEYVSGLGGNVSIDREELDMEHVNSVGARGGTWVAWNVAEEWEYWIAKFGVVRSVWERDLALTSGAEETEIVELARRVVRNN